LEQFVTIKLFGRPYTFRTDNDSTQAQEVADYLVREVHRVKSESERETKISELNEMTVLLIAALNIALENHKLRLDQAELVKSIAEHSKKIVHLLDSKMQNR